MSPDPFDEIDSALRTGLSGLAPEVHDEDAALAAMRPRFRRARTRARVTKAGGAILGLVAIGSVATIATVHTGPGHVSVSSRSSTSVSSSTSSTVRSPTTSVSVKKPVTTPGIAPNPSTPGPTTPRTGGTTPGSVPATTPDPNGGRGGGPAGGGGNPGPGGGSTTTTTPAPADQVVVYQSAGGSITVRFSQRSVLSLVRVTPARGYVQDVRDSGPDRVEVRFRSGEAVKSDIGVRIVNGRMVRTDHT